MYKRKWKSVLKDYNWKVFLKRRASPFLPWLKDFFQKTFNENWIVTVYFLLYVLKTYKRQRQTLNELFWNFELFVFLLASKISNLKNLILSLKKFQSLWTMTFRRIEVVMIPSINNEKDVKSAFLEESFIPGWWVNFQGLEEEGFLVRWFFDGHHSLKSLAPSIMVPMPCSREEHVRIEPTLEAPSK